MAARQMKPRKGIIAVALSSLLIALSFTGTALAAHNAVIEEINHHDNDELAVDQLFTSSPRTERPSAIKKHSLPTDDIKLPSASSLVRKRDLTESKLPNLTARIPGISNNGLARVKRQMYRKDI